MFAPGGVLGISSDGDDRRIFLGLKFSILGFFWEGKFGKYFFGWLDLSWDFLGITDPGCVALRIKPNRGSVLGCL